MEGRGCSVPGLEGKSSSGQVSWRNLWKAKTGTKHSCKDKKQPGPSPTSHGFHSASQAQLQIWSLNARDVQNKDSQYLRN